MAKHIKRSVIPIYLIGVVWLVFALFFSLRTLTDYALCAVASAAVFVVGKAVFPDRVYQMPGEQSKEPEKPKQEKKKQETTGDPELDKLIQERDRAVSEMRRLNDSIEDPKISAQIDHMEAVTAKIIAHVVEHPRKLPQIRKFLNYYLPTTLKLLNAYDRMGAAGVEGANIDGTMGRIDAMMDKVVEGFEKQLDKLFQDDAMDIATDVQVLERMLEKDGLSGGGMTLGG
mgnify:CR=1 FL=1